MALGCYGYIIVLQNYRRQNEPPHAWSWIPILGSAIEFGKDPLAFLVAQRKKMGDIFTAYIGGNRLVFVCDHMQWKSLFRQHALQFKPIAVKVRIACASLLFLFISPSDCGILKKQRQ